MMEEIRKVLLENSDERYREFNIKTNPGAVNSLGVRIPVLRTLAKEVTGSDFRKFLASDFGANYEENMIRGIVIATAKMSTEERLGYARKFVPRIRDWATCDTLCASFKINAEELEAYWDFIRAYENSGEEFEVRFMLVMMLDYFLIPDYQADVLDIVNENKNTLHFAEMAAAWLIAESFIKNYELTLTFMKAESNKLSKFVYNKGLQKTCESRRIADTQKAELRELKKH